MENKGNLQNGNVPENNMMDGNGQQTPGEKRQKRSIAQWALHKKDQIMATKFGRWGWRIVKGATVGGACYLSYKAGKKAGTGPEVHVEIRGQDVPEQAEEPAVQEPTTEKVDEETGEVIG